MSKKFFRPTPQLEDDSEDDDSDDDDDDDELVDDDDEDKGPDRAANANLSDDDDDDDDEEEEEEDDDDSDEEDRRGKKRRKSSTVGGKKRPKAASFFELEAEASDDEDEEGDERRGRHKDDEGLDEEARELIRQQDRRRAQAGGRFGERSVAEISRDIEQRHRMQRRTVDRSMIIDRPSASGVQRHRPEAASGGVSSSSVAVDEGRDVYAATSAVAQQSLVPSVSDPSLWMVSCATGKEQELVFQIMNKCSALARQGRPLGISAAIAAQSKGKIYIESFSEPAVMEAIQGVRGLLQYTMRLVPIQDMTTVMTVTSKKKPVKKNEWVRMTRGHYKGDLALVMAVKESGLKCIVQCVPRLDLTLSDLPPEEARIRRKTVRPPQKFFNVQEISAQGRQSDRRRFPGLDMYCEYFENNYYHDGYLLKEMTVGSMVKPITDDDPPTLDELQRFQKRKSRGDGYDDDVQEENEGSKMAASLLDELSELQGKTGLGKSDSANRGLLIGDTVEVIEGDLVGMRGKLVNLDGNSVKIKPLNTAVDLGGTGEIEFLANQVRKYIAVGAHVKVTDGRYANETGVVVAVEKMDGETDCTAVILTDVTNKEVSVRTSQLRESAEVASGQDKLQGYELYDLVVLSGGGSANEVGVIVRVGREDFTVINNHGIAREVRPEELRGKRNAQSGRAVALDVQGSQIRVGDTVNIAEGPHKGKTATIKRMNRAQLFLHSQTRSEHAGIFVVRSRSCVLAGARAQNSGASADGGVSPFATPQSQSGGHAAARGRRDDGLIGKTVRIQAGQWKGHLGMVVDSTATHVQVELHSRHKKVMVVRERVAVAGDKFGASDEQNQPNVQGMAAAPSNMATPMHVAVGGATPAIHAFGGATPSHDSETTDDVWRPGGAIDQESIKDDGWGSPNDNQYNANPDGENDGGWGSSGATANAWGAPAASIKTETSVKQESDQSAYKRVQAKSEMQTIAADNEETPAWFMERVCVQVKDKGSGTIKEINADKSAVIEMDDKTTTTARVGDLSMVPPKEHDTVLVTGGNDIGVEGSLVCVDGKFDWLYELGFVLVTEPSCLILRFHFFLRQALMQSSKMPKRNSRLLTLSTWSRFRPTEQLRSPFSTMIKIQHSNLTASLFYTIPIQILAITNPGIESCITTQEL